MSVLPTNLSQLLLRKINLRSHELEKTFRLVAKITENFRISNSYKQAFAFKLILTKPSGGRRLSHIYGIQIYRHTYRQAQKTCSHEKSSQVYKRTIRSNVCPEAFTVYICP